MQKSNFKILWQNWNIAIFLALLKLLIHFVTNTNYGFHRDEYLYLALGEHLSWGYMEVPPVIAILGKLAHVLGGSLFVVRMFPALVGSLTIFLIAVMVRDLGGKKWAQVIACLAFILSPVFLRNNTLFQPVSFNQFWWFLSALIIVRLIKYEKPKYWYYLGIVGGLGFLTKYSVIIFYSAFAIALIFTPQRKWLKTKYPYLAFGIALMIMSPNIFWQFSRNLPFLTHFTDIVQQHLVNIQPGGFLTAQLRMNHAGLIVWITGLIYLFFSKKFSNFRILGWLYLIIILLLLILGGKPYYSMGAYTMLFAVGGVVVEIFFERRVVILRYLLVFIFIIISIPVMPYGLPILYIEKMERYSNYLRENFSIDYFLVWEDGKIYSLPQDYADMHGWEELAIKVSNFYHSLPLSEKSKCVLFSFNWGYAASLYYYRHQYNLPEVYSLYSSFLIWSPATLDFDRQILVDEIIYDKSVWFNKVQLVDSLRLPYSRVSGNIYYRTNAVADIKPKWTNLVKERKGEYNF